MTAPGAPDPPTALQVTSLAPSSLHLEWKVCHALGNCGPLVTSASPSACSRERQSSCRLSSGVLGSWEGENAPLDLPHSPIRHNHSSCPSIPRQSEGSSAPPPPYRTTCQSFPDPTQAISAAGHSDWSPPLTITTPPSIPSPPTHLHIVTRSPTTLHVAWAIPESHGAPITAYHIEASPGHVTSSLDHVTSVPTSETQCTVENLHPKTTYRLALWCVHV